MDRRDPRPLPVALRLGWGLIVALLIGLISLATATLAEDLEPTLGAWSIPAAIVVMGVSIGFICIFVRTTLSVPSRERTGSPADISESIDRLEIHTVVVVIGDDSFPAAYEYYGVSDSGVPQWLGIGMDDFESVYQWDSDRIVGVYRPPAEN